MKNIAKKIFITYLILVLVKLIISYFIPAPSAHADYYTYTKMARSFFMFGEFSIHGVITTTYPPLYPIFLSISYLFNDMDVVYFFMKFINILLITSIIFPSYLLAKEFLSKKDAYLVALLISFIPSVFAFSVYIMAENLFYPLFLFFVYFLYKSFMEKSYKWDILAGLFIGFAYLTKVIGIALIPVVFFSFIFYVLRYKKDFILQLKKKFILGIVALLTILPWILRNTKLYGFSFASLLGGDLSSSEAVAALSGKYTLEAFVTMCVFYLTFFILSSGIVFFVSNLSVIKRMFKDKKFLIISTIFLSSLLFFILIAANHNSAIIKHFTLYPWLTGKFVGRYLDAVLPLVFILGFIGYNYFKKDKTLIKYSTVILSLIFLFASQLIYVSLYPINNLSLTWIGVLNYLVNYLFYGSTSFTSEPTLIVSLIFALGFIVLLFINVYFMKRISLRKFLPYLMAFFLLVALVKDV